MFIQKSIEKKTAQVLAQVHSCLDLEKTAEVLSSQQFQTAKACLEKTQMHSLTVTILKIVNLIVGFFYQRSKCIDDLLEANTLTGRLIQNYSELISNPNPLLDDTGFVYDVSFERLKNKCPQLTDKPLKITMVGAEYAGLVKQGGLAEAIEGLSRALFDAGHTVELILPKYSCLPSEITQDLSKPDKYTDSSGESYSVFRKKINGVECLFIDHPNFDLGKEVVSVYGPDFTAQAERFAKFSAMAADLIYKRKTTDIIHLHDWHVAGVGLKLKKDHPEEWIKGEIPPVVFTFHNNQRPMQGRLTLGPYSYDPVIQGYLKHGIINRSENLFVEALMNADAVTTVSETFGMEAQQVSRGEGISFAVRQAARIGKLTGILNGANLDRWNPETDVSLRKWKDIDSNQKIDLGYGADSDDILEKKQNIREQLQKWTQKYLPKTGIDFSKPLVTYIGRFDARQKGIDRLETGIEATLKNGGQFICMGTDEDEKSKHILDRLQQKYKQGVLFLRDKRDASGKLFYQQGDATRPGIGSLIRAATDFGYIPSHFEPCGLVQFEGWQFGSMAIGASTGGLADTIIPEKNGFLFKADPAQAIENALTYWKGLNADAKQTLISNLMTNVRQSGWRNTAQKYLYVYANALKNRTVRHIPVPLIVENLKYRKLAPLAPTDCPEEQYMAQFYQHDHDSAKLKELFELLPEEVYSQVPSPYGQKVDFAKYEQLGSFPNGRFAVSAPNAKKVELVLAEGIGSSRSLSMTNNGGVWQIHVPAITVGQKYQYRIDGIIKIDPYAHQFTSIPDDSKEAPYSVVSASTHNWKDNEWIHHRMHSAGKPQPMSIYEVHPMSWKRQSGRPLNYREFAHELLIQCKKHGHTHVELMGILEHPHEDSFGYQVSGYFAPTNRMGTVDDFKYLIDLLHREKIGVILDFVPAHFASDSWGLNKFDGTNQYGAHGISHYFSARNWGLNYGAKQFDFKQKEVREFLISSAMYWIKEMHIDGLRVDCVRSLLNSEDPESANLFMCDLNGVIHNHGQGAISIAEDFSGDEKVTVSPLNGGLDFDMKWHSGFVHHMFQYFQLSPHSRKSAYQTLIDAIQCDNSHKQVMFISHDQAEEFFKLNQKIADPSMRQAQARAISSLLMCLPGKKLHFMTAEGASATNWKSDHASKKKPGWFDQHTNDPKFSNMMARLNQLYKEESSFHEFDANGHDLEWIDDQHQNLHVYRRKNSKGDSFLCVHNFTDAACTVTLDKVQEVFNSDSIEFGGSGGPTRTTGSALTIAPLSTLILKEAV